MATVRDIVTLALKQGRVLGLNATPTSTEASAGLTAFQLLLDSWVANGMFGRLTDVYKTADYTAEEGERVIAPTAITVTFPTTVEGDEGDRAPRDLAIIETVLNGTRAVKVYDRTGWVSLLGLTLDSAAPFAGRGESGLAACVARHFCEMFGREIGPNTANLAANFERGLSWKRGTSQDRKAAEYY